jgi:ABC-type amino acid transport system permease subunit
MIIGGVPELEIPKLNGFRFDGGVTLSSEFTALLVAIVFFGSSYIAECIRGGVESVPRGQVDAAHALGLTKRQAFWLIILREALPNIIPPLGNQYLFLVRATTLGVAVGYADLFMVASTAINQTGRSIEILVFVAAIFLVINYLMTVAINLVNKSVSFHERVRA